MGGAYYSVRNAYILTEKKMYVEIQNIEHSMLKYRTQYVEIRIQNTGTELKRKEAFWVQCVELKFRM